MGVRQTVAELQTNKRTSTSGCQDGSCGRTIRMGVRQAAATLETSSCMMMMIVILCLRPWLDDDDHDDHDHHHHDDALQH